jgi:hypothetical protein
VRYAENLRPGTKGKIIHVTGRGDPLYYETSKLPHFLDKPLTYGGEVVSLTRPLRFHPQRVSWYPFLSEGELTARPYKCCKELIS